MTSTAAKLNQFLIGVEKKGFGMAQVAVNNTDDALDIVQNTMLTLVKKYSNKPESEWAPLFFRILQNNITDFHRKKTRTNKIFSWFSNNERDQILDVTDLHAARDSDQPEIRSEINSATEKLQLALHDLPERQQQTFLLRCWEGMSVAETAQTMQCSEGSVKTHYSRAIHKLRDQLKDEWL